MEELISEHRYARQVVSRLRNARERDAGGDPGARREILQCLKDLVQFYPRHIQKEDQHFFLPVMGYFSRPQQEDMIGEFHEFDRQMFHEHYRQIVADAETHLPGNHPSTGA